MNTKEIDVSDLQQDLEPIVDVLVPGDSIIVTKAGKPHERLEPFRPRIQYGTLAEYAVPDADITDMDPDIEAMFEGREFTMMTSEARRNADLFKHAAASVAATLMGADLERLQTDLFYHVD